ncbi:hypothetical protein V6N11_057171 [Hibiscus sabdariffa]|uniref:Glyoxylate reductase n=1 Tax=Hibiscus sabdariffa TaxID=183260 RepID=A0ABR1ZGS1_9ROSI
MESIGVLMTCPMNPYLEQELAKRFTLHRLWKVPDKSTFLTAHRNSIRAVVGSSSAGADAELIEALPKLEIVASFSVGLDKIDLAKCKEKGIRVTNTPDVLTDDAADLAVGLMLAVLRKLCESDRHVRSGKWKKGTYMLTTKVEAMWQRNVWLLLLLSPHHIHHFSTRNAVCHCHSPFLHHCFFFTFQYLSFPNSNMESIGVLMACPMNPYLEQELDKRFTLHRFWKVPEKSTFLTTHCNSIRAVVGNASSGADAQMIEALPKLEIVASFSVGLDKIDLAKCKEKGIRVTNTPDVLTEDVADLAIGLMLAVLRKLCESDRYVRSGKWKKGSYMLTTKCFCVLDDFDEISLSGLLLDFAEFVFLITSQVIALWVCGLLVAALVYLVSFRSRKQAKEFGTVMPDDYAVIVADFTSFTGKRVGIIGLGRIGMAIAKRAEAFSCPISYHSRTEKTETKYKYYPSVVELAANCDILVVACSLTEETRHIVNRKVIDALGAKGVLINIGRGPHVDEPELVSALVERRIGGAGLDVFEHEPEVPEELFGLDNVVLLPHVGSGTVETRKAMADLVLGNLEAHFMNKPLLTPVV